MRRVRVFPICFVLLVCSLAFGQRAPIPQQLTFAPYHANGIYKIGETVGWTVTSGPDAPTYVYKWTIRRDNAVVLKEGKLDLSTGKDTIEIVGDQPEMIYVAIEPYAALAAAPSAPTPGAAKPGATTASPNNPAPDAASTAAATTTAAQAGSGTTNSGVSPPPPHWMGGNTGRNNGLYAVGAAVAPTDIPLSTPRPADFDSFWDGKLALQAKVPSRRCAHAGPERRTGD